MIICIVSLSQIVLADQFNYGPRFEVGVGPSLSRMKSRPEWTSKLYAAVVMNLSYRIIYGLSIHGGKNAAYGFAPSPEWIDYGSHNQINTDKGTYGEATWLGARYDIPLSKFNYDFNGIHTIYIAGGTTWDEYGIRSEKQRYYATEQDWDSGKYEEKTLDSAYKTADLKGYYIALAARWRLDTAHTEEKDSWIGSYGLDIGVKYTGYTDYDTKFDNIMDVRSNFNYYQIFIIGFLKFRFLY